MKCFPSVSIMEIVFMSDISMYNVWKEVLFAFNDTFEYEQYSSKIPTINKC